MDRLPPDAVLECAELARLLHVETRHVPQLLTGPFRANPEAIPARVALGLVILQKLGEQNVLQPEHAVAVASAAMHADPAKTRHLAVGWNKGRCAAAWVLGDVSPDLTDAFRSIDFVPHNHAGLLPVDLIFYDVLTTVAIMRSGKPPRFSSTRHG